MRAFPRRNETHIAELVAIHQVHAVGIHIGDVEDRSVRREFHVLGHAVSRQGQAAEQLLVLHVHLNERSFELATGDQIFPVG